VRVLRTQPRNDKFISAYLSAPHSWQWQARHWWGGL
jgi:hypothetical protein